VVERTNLENLGWGTAFSVVGLVFLAERIGWWDLQQVDLALLGPMALVAVGLVVLASSFLTGRAQR
jgi:GT2 family glycosyltransferase